VTHEETFDLVWGANPRIRAPLPLMDFLGAPKTFVLAVPLFDVTANANTILVGANSRGRVKVPRAGRLISAHLLAEDALAKHADNHITFTVTNELASGSGTAEMLSTTTGANTTDNDLASAVAITAKTGRAFTISGTAASLRVAEGDHILVTATVAGTLANAVDLPVMILTFATIPDDLTPLIARTAGSPLVGPVDAVANGEITGVLSATNEVNTAAVYGGDKLDIIGSYGPILRGRIKVGTIAANERFVFGLCSAYNATWDSTTINAWFRLEGSMALLAETDDDTSNRDDQATGITLVAGTYYDFIIDLAVRPGYARFRMGNRPPLDLAMGALASTHLLQVICAVQKASGTGVPSWTADLLECHVERA
jgi:hypothetical protein